MKQITFKRKSNYSNSWKSVIFLLILMAAIGSFGRLSKLLEIKTAEASQLPQVKEENQLLKNKLEASSKIETPDTTKEIVRFYIRKYFPKSEWSRAEKITTCESNMNPQVVNHNKNKTADRGVWQINEVHAKRFEKMFGIKWEIGSHDIELSTKYAEFLFKDQSWRPWVCNKLIAKGGE